MTNIKAGFNNRKYANLLEGQGLFCAFFYKEFIKRYPVGSEEYSKFSKICGHFETIGTLWKHKLINEELLFDWLAVDMVWNRVKGVALGVRQESGEPRLFENFEAMANAATV